MNYTLTRHRRTNNRHKANSELAAPLTDMLASKKSDKLVWGQNEINSFERLKTQLLGKPVLRPPDPNKPFKLFCDANAVSVAGLLMQYDEHAENNNNNDRLTALDPGQPG